jgi:hypothetical protein
MVTAFADRVVRQRNRLGCLEWWQPGSPFSVPDDELAEVQRHLDHLAEIRLQHDLSPEQQDEYAALARAEKALLVIEQLTDTSPRRCRRLPARG